MYLTSYSMHWVGNSVINDIRSDLFSTMIRFPISFFRGRSTGMIMSHYLNDIQMIQNAASAAVKNGIRSFFEAVFLVSFAFVQNWKLAFLLLIVGPAIAYTIKKMGKIIKQASLDIQQDVGNVSSMLQEVFVGIREIKAFGAESFEEGRFKKYLDKCFSSIMNNVHADSLLPVVVEIFAMVGGGVAFYFATHQVLSKSITPGQLTSFVAAVLLAYQPLKRLVSSYGEIQYGLSAASRIFAIMDLSFPQTDRKAIEMQPFAKAIMLNHVSFSYDGKKELFKDLFLSIPRGACVGVIGPSGSGKSTLCDLLLGFIEPTAGKITIDGVDLATISHDSVMKNIGYVGQRAFLFNDTIMRNVAYAMTEYDEQKVIAACKLAHAHEFIRESEHGYQTLVGENGCNISGGQKQRLTIARALMKDPDILIFDEVTSSLDRESERMIQLSLQELHHKKTLFIVSHRPALLEHIDMLLLVRDGTVVQVDKASALRYSSEAIP